MLSSPTSGASSSWKLWVPLATCWSVSSFSRQMMTETCHCVTKVFFCWSFVFTDVVRLTVFSFCSISRWRPSACKGFYCWPSPSSHTCRSYEMCRQRKHARDWVAAGYAYLNIYIYIYIYISIYIYIDIYIYILYT